MSPEWMSAPWVRVARIAFTLLMAAVMTVVIVNGWDEVTTAVESSGFRLALSFPLALVAVVAGGVAWGRLTGLGRGDGIRAFVTSLPARYLPLGSAIQLVGQSGLAVERGVEAKRAAIAAITFIPTLAVGALLVTVPSAFASSTPTWIRLSVVALLVFSLGVWMKVRSLELSGEPRNVFERTARAMRGVPVGGAVAWSALSVGSNGLAWWVITQETNALLAASVFATAWLAGFLFIVAPSGFGAREGMLVLLSPGVEASVVIAASLALRAVIIAAEATLFVAASLPVRRSRSSGQSAS